VHRRCRPTAFPRKAIQESDEVDTNRIVHPVGGIGFPTGHDPGLDAFGPAFQVRQELPRGGLIFATSRYRADYPIGVAESGIEAPGLDVNDLATVGEGAHRCGDGSVAPFGRPLGSVRAVPASDDLRAGRHSADGTLAENAPHDQVPFVQTILPMNPHRRFLSSNPKNAASRSAMSSRSDWSPRTNRMMLARVTPVSFCKAL
jgi:hypothetical protein